MATRVTGIDIGTRSVRAVILESKLRGFELAELLEVPIQLSDVASQDSDEPVAGASEPSDDEAPHEQEAPPPEEQQTDADRDEVRDRAIRSALRELADRGAFNAEYIVTAAPEQEFYLATLDLPFAGPKEIRAVLGPQLDGKLPRDVDELHLDFMVLGKRPSGENLIYAGGIEHEAMSRFMSMWSELEVDPRVVDVQPFPLYTAARWLSGTEGDESAQAWIDFGAQHTRIVVFRGDHLQMVRTIFSGSDNLTEELAATFDLGSADAEAGKHREGAILDAQDPRSEDEAQVDAALRKGLRPLVRDIRRTLTAHAGENSEPVASITICGGGAQLKGLAPFLEETLQVPVKQASFARDELASNPQSEARGVEFVAALGLALRAFPQTGASRFNLRHGVWAFKGAYEYITQRVPAMLGLAAILFVAFVLFLVSRSALMKAEYNAVDDAMAQLTREVFGSELRDPVSVQNRLQRGARGTGLHPEISAYDLLAQIANVATATVDLQMPLVINDIDVDMARRQFTINGVCDSAQAAETFQELLQSNTCADEVRRTSLNERRGDNRFDFGFSGSVDCASMTEEDS